MLDSTNPVDSQFQILNLALTKDYRTPTAKNNRRYPRVETVARDPAARVVTNLNALYLTGRFRVVC